MTTLESSPRSKLFIGCYLFVGSVMTFVALIATILYTPSLVYEDIEVGMVEVMPLIKVPLAFLSLISLVSVLVIMSKAMIWPEYTAPLEDPLETKTFRGLQLAAGGILFSGVCCAVISVSKLLSQKYPTATIIAAVFLCAYGAVGLRFYWAWRAPVKTSASKMFRPYH
jgi:hypothetical protein